MVIVLSFISVTLFVCFIGFPFFAIQNYRGQPHPGVGLSVILFDKGDEILVINQSDRDWWEVSVSVVIVFNLIELSIL
jgi:hypothetical protein